MKEMDWGRVNRATINVSSNPKNTRLFLFIEEIDFRGFYCVCVPFYLFFFFFFFFFCCLFVVVFLLLLFFGVFS